VELCLMIEGQENVTWEGWVALARACEEHGVGTLFRSDHYLSVDDRRERGALDAWTTIAGLGAVSQTLRFGTLVSPASFRHPSVLAKAVVCADHISGGRVELGLGTGWWQAEHEAYGFAFRPMAERMEVLAEQVEIICGQWAEEPFAFAGRHYTLTEVDARPKPVQRPRPPLLLGGMAGPKSAALAARWADEYNTVYPTVDDVRERRANVERACAQAGRAPLRFSAMTGFLLGRDDAEVRDRARRLAEWQGEDVSDPDGFRDGLPDAWIVGTVEQAAEQLHALQSAGLDRVMLQHHLHDDLDAVALIGGELARAVG
jgi:alkanesulfonate monooxygenase SsuD/methylene tetrahydromethanopterin reductase-like flavin-dependent oxidoreductase (luciferase family)